ncbi:hypothetical protein BN1047_03145 [Mycolicibacterium neoaurum]|uniref:Uncharacterized protein n=1 Tax=Mycolicibacterium neoaurum TaxID=1795 RepID=A0AAV2WMS3_MYCNE|nr:hypothetical protein BN1047_03145 [Mycolicibacterium neoaurum]
MPRRSPAGRRLRPARRQPGRQCARSDRAAARSGSSGAYADGTYITSVGGSSASARSGSARLVSVSKMAASTGATGSVISASLSGATPADPSDSSIARRRERPVLFGFSSASLAIRSATVTPSVWLPVSCVFVCGVLVSGVAARSHGAAPGAGRSDRVSQSLSPRAWSGRPGVALSPSLMSYRPSTRGACAPLRTDVVWAARIRRSDAAHYFL